MVGHLQRLYRKTLCLLIVATVTTSMHGYCQYVSSKNRFVFDHEAYVSNTLALGPREMTSGIMGDFINLDSGELSLRQTDVELKGNFDLPVSLVRFIDSDNDRPKFTTSEITVGSTGTANWGLELPYILLHTITKDGTVGCVSSDHSVTMFDKLHVVPRLSIGRNRRWTLLKTANTSNTAVFGATSPDYTTSSKWRINQSKKSGKCSWKAVAPNGDTYEFGQPYILGGIAGGVRKHAVLITKITDVHGNWVRYSYDKTHKRLKTITSSDKRKLQLVYRSNHELEGVVANGRKWVYSYKTVSTASKVKYLYRATLPDKRYWEFDKLRGINLYWSSFHAQRCIFGFGAKVRHYSGAKATYKTRKIINFVAASSPNGHLNNSHRAECLPPEKFFGAVFKDDIYRQIRNGKHYLSQYYAESYLKSKISQAMASDSLPDGKSKFGNFSTYFTSAVTEKKLESPDGENITWQYDYEEGDLFNGDYSKNTSIKSVHKAGKVVEVDVSKPKKRTVTDPLGTKYEFNFGRGLHNSGALISESIYPKGSQSASRKVEYEYVYSKKMLGTAWDCSKPKPMVSKAVNQNFNQSSTEKWRRVSKRTITQDGEVYKTSNEFDDRGSLIKTTNSSTVQTGSTITKRSVRHLTSKWILNLTASITENGKEFKGFTHDANGKVTLETRHGFQFRRYSWYADGSLAAIRDGNNNMTKFENYKRGIAQKTTKPSGAILQKVVDANGWITSETDALGFSEVYTFDKVGRVSNIDRPNGYADSTITYSEASSSSGRVETITTGVGTQKSVKKTTFNMFGDELLIETRDISNATSVFIRNEFDKLGRKIFESMPASVSSATAGIKASFDSLGRVSQLKFSVSPFSTIGISYLSDNRIRVTDASGNVTVKHRSGYSTPDDGKVVKIEYSDGAITNVSYDNWLNVTSVQFEGDGNTLERTYKYDSRLDLCFQEIPESGTEAFTYDATRQKITSEKGVSSTYVCSAPATVAIKLLPKPKVPSSPKPTTPASPSPSPSKPIKTQPKSTYCGSWMVWVPSYNKCMNAGIVSQCGSWILTSLTKNGCFFNPSCSISPASPAFPSNPICTSHSYRFSTPASESVNSNIVRYEYNSDGVATSIDYPDGTPDITNTYDLGGNLIKTVSGDIVITYTYGKRGELKSETLAVDNETYSVAYVYDETGGRISYKTPGGETVYFTLNAFNQVTAFNIGVFKYVSDATYHPDGTLKSAKLHYTKLIDNSSTISLSNTLNSQLLVSKSTLTGSNKIFSFSNTYFKDGKLNTVVDTLNKSSGVGNRTFTYSERGFVKSAKGPQGLTTYTHDKFSNLLSQISSSRSVILQVDSTTNQVVKYTRTAKIGGVNVSSNPTISHDTYGRITNFRNMELTYDHADRLTRAKESGKFEDQSFYDGNHNRAKFIEKNLENGLNQKRHIFYSKEGPLLARILVRGSSPVEKHFSDLINFGENLSLHIFSCAHWIYHSHTNNTIISLNPDNSISATSSIGPFGTTWSPTHEYANPCDARQSSASALSSSEITRKSRIVGDRLFRNVERDVNSELYFLGTKRFYDAFGRYLVPDSSKYLLNKVEVDIENANLYAIAQNDPINTNIRGFRDFIKRFDRLVSPSGVPIAHKFEEYFQN